MSVTGFIRNSDAQLIRTIPLGMTETITLPELDFQLQGDFPLNLKVDAAPPELALSWGFKMSFGFDEKDGFFVYTCKLPSRSTII